jgi:hypothetical protein
VSYLVYLGYNIEDVSQIAGHSSPKVTDVYYLKLLKERKREMQSDLGSHMIKHLPNRENKNGGKNVARKRGKKGPLNAQS